MMKRSIVTTDVAVCLTTLGVLSGTRCDVATQTALSIMTRVGLETVRVVAASEALPNVMKGKSFALRELLNVTVFVKKQLGMQPRAVREKYRPAKRDRSDGRLP